jgi:hypothetical protein
VDWILEADTEAEDEACIVELPTDALPECVGVTADALPACVLLTPRVRVGIISGI